MSSEDMTPVSDSTAQPQESADTAPIEQDEVLEGDDQTLASEAASLEALKAEANRNLEGWQRTLAEFQNYRRRIEREQRENGLKAQLDSILKALPIIDDFERAMANIPEEFKGHPWIDGIVLIQSKFQKWLDEHNVTVIDPVGEPFDPSRHEAVGSDSQAAFPSGHVTTTLQKGYICGERVMRPALVRVAV